MANFLKTICKEEKYDWINVKNICYVFWNFFTFCHHTLKNYMNKVKSCDHPYFLFLKNPVSYKMNNGTSVCARMSRLPILSRKTKFCSAPKRGFLLYDHPDTFSAKNHPSLVGFLHHFPEHHHFKGPSKIPWRSKDSIFY